MTDSFFKHRTVNFKRLLEYGFQKTKYGYSYTRLILDSSMSLEVKISKSGKLTAEVLDLSSDEEYILHLVKNASGTFIGQVRSEYENALSDIADKCFDKEIFISPQTKRVIEYFATKYGNTLEHLWADAPDNAIVRRQDTQKWYAAILTVSRRKLGIDSDEIVEIIDLHVSPDEIPNLVDNVYIFPGFHMNKKHWITVILDGTMDDCRLFELIDKSYALGKK